MNTSNYMWYCHDCKKLHTSFTKHYKHGKICIKCQGNNLEKVPVSKRMKNKCKREGLYSIPFVFKRQAITNVEMRAYILTALSQKHMEK